MTAPGSFSVDYDAACLMQKECGLFLCRDSRESFSALTQFDPQPGFSAAFPSASYSNDIRLKALQERVRIVQAHVTLSIGFEVLIVKFDKSRFFDFGSWRSREKMDVPIGNGIQNLNGMSVV